MKIGIDIDGTITANPEFFKALIASHLYAGDEVHIITGGIQPGFGYEFNSQSRIKQLSDLGIHRWSYLVRCYASTSGEVANLKGQYCKDFEIDCLFEDTLSYIEAVKKISPLTQTFLIQ